MKNVLNVIVDILTLMALCVAAIGHVLPWFREGWAANIAGIGGFQLWHWERSGTFLGILAALICLSLIFRWGPGMRRVLSLAMFGSAFTALVCELLVFSTMPIRGRPEIAHRIADHDVDIGYMMSVVPTGIAVFFCLLRMLWTMPPTRKPQPIVPVTADKQQPVTAMPVPGAGFPERRV